MMEWYWIVLICIGAFLLGAFIVFLFFANMLDKMFRW